MMSEQTGPKLVKSHTRDNASLVHSFVSYLGAQGYADNTRRAYGRVAADFADFLHSTSLLEIDRPITREYLAYLRDRGCSNATVAREVHGLKALFAFLDLADLLPTNPLRLLRNPKQVRKLPRFLTEQEMERLLAAADNRRDKAILEVMYATGCRISELCSIRLEDVDFEGRSIRVIGKGNKECLLIFGSRAARAMKAYLNGRERGFLFQSDGIPLQKGRVVLCTNKRGRKYWLGLWQEYREQGGKVRRIARSKYLGAASKFRTKEQARRRFKELVEVPTERPKAPGPLNTRTVRNIIYWVAQQAGLGHRNPHAIRHSFATHLLDRGADLLYVSKLMRHENISTTAIYLHTTTASLRRVYDRCHPRSGKGKHGK
jgi:site-specific recombinase XerD